jgi:hypothetical protein
MSRFQFLSEEWLEETRRIREQYRDQVPAVPVPVRMNQVINEVPFGDGVVKAHVDTSSGTFDIDTGHLENPDLTVTLTYATAKALLVDGDVGAAMNAFMSGKIRVDGDVTKLIALQTAGAGAAADPAAGQVVKRIQEITA